MEAFLNALNIYFFVVSFSPGIADGEIGVAVAGLLICF
jgi:hypothetical protein